MHKSWLIVHPSNTGWTARLDARCLFLSDMDLAYLCSGKRYLGFNSFGDVCEPRDDSKYISTLL